MQDVFAKLLAAMPGFEFDVERGRFRTWLWRVTQNVLTDFVRRRITRDRTEQGWLQQHELALAETTTENWDELYRRRILQVVLERVRSTTPSASWACFERRILAGRPALEIATETGYSVNAVYINASRLLARARRRPPPGGIGPPGISPDF